MTNSTNQRVAGLLLHPTSLPGGHGVGDLGPEAFRFVDFLGAAGQQLWQIMPLGPPGYGESPYAARSAFAGNPLLISLDQLVDQGLLEPADLDGAPLAQGNRANFSAAETFKLDRLQRAHRRFTRDADSARRQAFDRFCREHGGWLDDFSLFMALRDVHGGRWTNWPDPVVRRQAAALTAERQRHAERVEFHAFVQYIFFDQWQRLRDHARRRGVRIVGDMPIFVAHDSADVWSRQSIYLLDQRGQPTVVAGVPPDAFSATGQRWGNPLYDWEELAGRGFDWWVERFRVTFDLVDVVRVDHFRGFQAAWHVPATEQTAENGAWVESPGAALFAAVRAALGELPIIAEDLGVITPPVEALRDALAIPGMKVLQFAFGGDADNPYLPHNHIANCVVYTGTHDNDTTLGWYQSASPAVHDHVRRYLGVDGHDIVWDMIRRALGSVAAVAIVPVQDIVALGSEARMNTPGDPHDNWAWRLTPGQLSDAVAGRLRELVELFGRAAPPVQDGTVEAEQ